MAFLPSESLGAIVAGAIGNEVVYGGAELAAQKDSR